MKGEIKSEVKGEDKEESHTSVKEEPPDEETGRKLMFYCVVVEHLDVMKGGSLGKCYRLQIELVYHLDTRNANFTLQNR